MAQKGAVTLTFDFQIKITSSISTGVGFYSVHHESDNVPEGVMLTSVE